MAFRNLILVFACCLIYHVGMTQIMSVQGAALLEKSKQAHDPDQLWETLSYELYLQEPRIGNPTRYSEVKLNNTTGAFELKRNRDEHVSTHLIDEEGTATVLLNGEPVEEDALIEKYRLYPDRNAAYRQFYQLMLGLPMSLDGSLVKTVSNPTKTTFNRQDALAIPVTLRESIISDRWILYLDLPTSRLLGMDLLSDDPENLGERIVFDSEFDLNGLMVPRIRTWYDLKTKGYLGSDILIK
ncbi:MAG: DUF6503 family protein [Bacteroidota bacterium]